jgi:CubicO group peptidase (beta-lactamase class C family)
MRRRERMGLSRVLTYGVISIGALSGFLRVAGAQELQKTVAAGPVFSETGPDAVAYGAPRFPLGSRATSEEVEHLVATYSLFDDLFISGIVIRAEEPWLFRRAQVEPKITYEFQSDHYTLEDYLRRNPTTGLLIAKDDTILFEHYQYARTDRHRFLSQSMAKTITSMLIGVAVAEGSIKSIDDTAAIYVPQLAGTEYGKTALRDLLHMASGIAFSENYDGKDDLSRLVADLASRKRAVDSVMQFNTRDVPPGTRFHYASVETLVLGIVLRSAVGKPITDYLREKIWQPIGAEANASWALDGGGQEIAYCCFNAVLRDYARLGRLLAYDGMWDGRQLIPRQWILDATTVRPGDNYLAPGVATAYDGYGYQVWIQSGAERIFVLKGLRGQMVLVAPASKLVMVHTAVRQKANDPANAETRALWDAVVRELGK